ncbi:hypothetical protein ACFLW4_02770 [Chloroflexota bacterium]
MSWLNNILPRDKLGYLLLVPVLGLAFYMAFIPHADYPYPLHVDEWAHLAYSKATLQASSTTYVDPWLGQSTVGLQSPDLEAGFHVILGVFHQLSGISWLTIFRYFPGVVLMLTVLSVYIMGRRQGFGWEAALFTCLIPTTVGILGPAFMVPLAMALLFIPLSLFLAFNFRTVWSYLAIFAFTCFLLSIHAATAIGLAIILFPYILLNLKADFKHSLGITLALAIPFLAPFPWIFDMLLPTARSLLRPTPVPTYVDIPHVIKDYGYLPIGLCLLGTFSLAIKGGKQNYGLIFGLLALLAMLFTFFTFHYGVSIMYERGLMYMMLMLGIFAGAGLMTVGKFSMPEGINVRLKVPLVMRNLGKVLYLALIIATLVVIIPARDRIPYYYMIDEQDYEAFVWIKENVSEDYEKAVLDPWKGAPFAAITERYVLSKIKEAPKDIDEEIYTFLESGCRDTSYLKENGVSIVYTRQECQNPDLTQVRENVYLLREAE